MNKNNKIMIDVVPYDNYGRDDCVNKDGTLKCDVCNYSEECDIEINNEYDDYYTDNFAELVNYGGYDSVEEFWNEIFE